MLKCSAITTIFYLSSSKNYVKLCFTLYLPFNIWNKIVVFYVLLLKSCFIQTRNRPCNHQCFINHYYILPKQRWNGLSYQLCNYFVTKINRPWQRVEILPLFVFCMNKRTIGQFQENCRLRMTCVWHSSVRGNMDDNHGPSSLEPTTVFIASYLTSVGRLVHGHVRTVISWVDDSHRLWKKFKMPMYRDT